MRPDMDKVVTERERAGGTFGNKGVDREFRVRHAEDDLDRLDSMPRHEGMKARYIYDRKSFTDVLGPLRGFLLKNAGRPWNKVQSEMARHLPKDSVQHLHVWSHVKDYVNEDIVVVEGKLYVKRTAYRRLRNSFLEPLDHTNTFIELFVDPRTGILRKNKWYRRRGWYGLKALSKEEIRRETKDPMVQLHKLNGLWFEVQLRPVTALLDTDPATKRPIKDAPRVYGRLGVCGGKKRALNTKELRAAGLTNTPPME